MKKLLSISLMVLLIIACNEKDDRNITTKVTAELNQNSLTVYDYLINESLMRSTLNDCISGKLSKMSDTCNKVIKANANIDNFKAGIISEERLIRLGKKE